MSFDVQIVHRRKPRDTVYLRLAPYTRENPTLNQMLHRIKVGEVAQGADGLKGLDPDTGLPRAASLVKDRVTGSFTGRTGRLPKWQELLSKELGEEIEAASIAQRLEELLKAERAKLLQP